jgi:tripartite-type tricarboxylate transporter receptor subunit TctC
MENRMNRIARRIAFVATALVMTTGALAQEWPTRPLRILVVAAAGGLPDLAARNIANALQRTLGQPVVVENRGGGAGNIASEAVAKAAPDGYTLLATGVNQAVNQVLFPKAGFDYNKDLTPVAMIGEANMFLLASPKLPVKNVAEAVALARAKPGAISMAVSVLGSPNHVGAELFGSMAGVELNFIPYKGVGATFPDLMAGNVDLAIAALPSAIGMVRGGKLRALAVTRMSRATQVPEIPTVNESGIPGFEINSWVALMITGGTPPAIIERIGTEARKALASQEVKAALESQGMESSQMTPAQVGDYIRAEVTKWTPVLKTARMQVTN